MEQIQKKKNSVCPACIQDLSDHDRVELIKCIQKEISKHDLIIEKTVKERIQA